MMGWCEQSLSNENQKIEIMEEIMYMEDLAIKAEENVGLIIAAIFLFSMGLAIVEFFWEWHKRQLTKWRLREMLSSFMVFIPGQLTEKAATAMFLSAFFLLDELHIK